MRFLLEYSEKRNCVYIIDRFNKHRNMKVAENNNESILNGIKEFYKQDCIDRGELDIKYQEEYAEAMIKETIKADDLKF